MISRQIDLTINKMTKAQYNGISPVADEVYVITDEAGCVTSVNGIQPDSSGNVTISIPAAVTESTVAGWGFTKNVGTVTSVNGVSPTNGNVAITLPTVNNGVLTLTQGGSTLGTFGANQSRNSVIDIPSGGSSRNIGEIVTSTIPLEDAGLHLLDGALISGSGSYSAFVDYIAGLVTDYPDLFDTEANWQSAVTQYGVCGKFVYDSVNNTVRLPKYNSKIYTGDGTAPVVGNGMALGLTDGTTNAALMYSSNLGISTYQNGYGSSVGSSATSSGISNKIASITTDTTKSGVIAQLSNITTSLDGYYYIVVATSTKTDIQVDIDEIATDLNGKADVDLSNVPTSKGILTESYVNGTSWYRVYSDGFCEQGGTFENPGSANTFVKVNLLKPYANTNYTVVATNSGTIATAYTVKVGSYTKNETDGFYIALGQASASAWWQASGYIS